MAENVAELLALAERVEAAKGADNSLDVEIDIALFQPSRIYAAVCANAARTKLVCTRPSGAVVVHWADDHTHTAYTRASAVAALRARAATLTNDGGGNA